MSFPDVDFNEFNLTLEFLVDLMKTHGPLDIGRSGETSEDQGYWRFPLEPG
jgi:hypothetical protein